MKSCSVCKINKDEKDFYINKKIKNRIVYLAACKICHRERAKKWRMKNLFRARMIRRLWQKNNPERVKAIQIRWKMKNPNLAKERAKMWHKLHRDKSNQQAKLRMQFLKNEVYNAYGGYQCVCCGETIKQFLSLDHINNDGNKHRKIVDRRKIYHWLKKNNFPLGYQVLCMNCNFGKARNNGICPHKLPKGSETILNGVGSSEPKRKAPQLEGEDIVQSTQRCVAAEMATIV